jgi:hypothetical protein
MSDWGILRAWGFTGDEPRAGHSSWGPVQTMDLSSITIAVQGQLMAACEMPRFEPPQMDASGHDRWLTGHRPQEQSRRKTTRRSLYQPRHQARKLQARGTSRLRNRLDQGVNNRCGSPRSALRSSATVHHRTRVNSRWSGDHRLQGCQHARYSPRTGDDPQGRRLTLRRDCLSIRMNRALLCDRILREISDACYRYRKVLLCITTGSVCLCFGIIYHHSVLTILVFGTSMVRSSRTRCPGCPILRGRACDLFQVCAPIGQCRLA